MAPATSAQYPRPFQSYGWGEDLNEPGSKNSPDYWSYTTVFEWQSPPEGRITWYRDFADGVPVYH